MSKQSRKKQVPLSESDAGDSQEEEIKQEQSKDKAKEASSKKKKAAKKTDDETVEAKKSTKKRSRKSNEEGSLKVLFVGAVLLMGAALLWLSVDLFIITEEASKIRPLTEKATHEIHQKLDLLTAYVEHTFLSNSTTDDPDRPGLAFAARGVKAHHPVVMVPGVVSTGLEIWNGRSCAMKHFRMRMWGTVTMVQKLLLDKQCWLDHMKLNKTTGLDPDGIKLRAASGLEAADYLFPGFWIWGKMIQNLADIGYDNNNLYMESYDWRLSYQALEQRDRFFTKLRRTIELAYATNENRKIVVLTHSMGSNMFYYFLNWVVADPIYGGGGAASDWVDKYIHSFVNIGGPMLGAPKALTALLSGEMRDTAQLGAFQSFVVENFFSRRQRAEMMRTWGSIPSLLPRGGTPIWGDEHESPDGCSLNGLMIAVKPCTHEAPLATAQHMVSDVIEQVGAILHKPSTVLLANKTVEDAIEFLFHAANDPHFERLTRASNSFGVATGEKLKTLKESRYWSNPLESALPYAPNMTIYCLYGVGKATERSYFYRNTIISQKSGEELEMEVIDTDEHDVPFHIDVSVSLEGLGLASGVHDLEGDGTVPLISLGYMCVEGWKRNDYGYNPSRVHVITKEYEHKPCSPLQDLRGGPATADHVDIMGNHEMTADILNIVSGSAERLKKDDIKSRIVAYSQKIDLTKK